MMSRAGEASDPFHVIHAIGFRKGELLLFSIHTVLFLSSHTTDHSSTPSSTYLNLQHFIMPPKGLAILLGAGPATVSLPLLMHTYYDAQD